MTDLLNTVTSELHPTSPPAAARFDFLSNRSIMCNPEKKDLRSCYDPTSYDLVGFELADLPDGTLRNGVTAQMSALKTAIECSAGKADLASAVRAIASEFVDPRDVRRASLHADAITHGYSDAALAELADVDGTATIVAGDIMSWYGKSKELLPTAFVSGRAASLDGPIETAMSLAEEMAAYATNLRAGLTLAPLPEFSAQNLVMMAGEGNLHPKHIAYFLPSDQGIAHSPFRRSYYFSNVHMALVHHLALPLARAHLKIDGQGWPAFQDPRIAAMGVLAHEAGHSVCREGYGFGALNRHDRWLSVTMQEVMADVFGTLFLTDVIAPALGFSPESTIAYHLAECLRYVDRGLGWFADSDGMCLQLNYLAQFGVLRSDLDNPATLCADAAAVTAAFRSLARVLADSLLADNVALTVELANRFGPATLHPIVQAYVQARSSHRPASLDYRMVDARHERPFSTHDVDGRPSAPDHLSGEKLNKFYCGPRVDKHSGNMMSLYEIWEAERGFGDSVTPSTYCEAYRTYMCGLITQRLPEGGSVFSIGCGNAFVERDLVSMGHTVDAIDVTQDAVRLAQAKGVGARVGDFLKMPQGSLGTYDVIYADGLIGHLVREDCRADLFMQALNRTAPGPVARLIFSNDAPRDLSKDIEPHPNVEDFCFISKDYLERLLLDSGYEVEFSGYYEYSRPISGVRKRTICIARATL